MDDRHQRNQDSRGEVNWSAVSITPNRPTNALDRSSRFPVGTALLIVGALAGHGALGYFGYRWIKSQSAPAVPFETLATPINARPRQNLPPVVQGPVAPKEQMTGKLHWSRREGMSVKPDSKDNWKCAGGYTYSTTIDENGAKIIELVHEGNRPLRCKG